MFASTISQSSVTTRAPSDRMLRLEQACPIQKVSHARLQPVSIVHLMQMSVKPLSPNQGNQRGILKFLQAALKAGLQDFDSLNLWPYREPRH